MKTGAQLLNARQKAALRAWSRPSLPALSDAGWAAAFSRLGIRRPDKVRAARAYVRRWRRRLWAQECRRVGAWVIFDSGVERPPGAP